MALLLPKAVISSGLFFCLISVRACRFKCWQDGRRHSPVDGQWYPVNASSNNAESANKKARLSVHLKLPKDRLQWKLQEQLQQKLDAHPEIADAGPSKDPGLSRQLLQNQFALAVTSQTKDPVFSGNLLQNHSAHPAVAEDAPHSVAVVEPDRHVVQ